MVDLAPPLRLATAADGPVLARLINAAGEGIPEYLWRQWAAPGEDPWELGARRQAEKAARGEVVVVDEGAGPVAALMAYPLGTEPEALDGLPPVVRPLQELENLAPATFYVNVLAALPGHRGKGWGTRLLAVAEEMAAEEGLTGLSIIVSDLNLLARRLYERTGYREVARRPMVRNGWQGHGREWVLMVKGAGTV